MTSSLLLCLLFLSLLLASATAAPSSSIQLLRTRLARAAVLPPTPSPPFQAASVTPGGPASQPRSPTPSAISPLQEASILPSVAAFPVHADEVEEREAQYKGQVASILPYHGDEEREQQAAGSEHRHEAERDQARLDVQAIVEWERQEEQLQHGDGEDEIIGHEDAKLRRVRQYRLRRWLQQDVKASKDNVIYPQ